MVSQYVKKLDQFASDISFGDALFELFKGKKVEIYLGEKSGSTHYADYDVEQKVFLLGEIVGAKGQVILIESEVVTPQKSYKATLAINTWAITGVMEQHNNIHISHVIDNTKR